jgi:hypothetical protein
MKQRTMCLYNTQMNKFIYPVSAGLLTILASLVAVPAQSQISIPSPTPSSSPIPSSSPTPGSSSTPSSSSAPESTVPTGSNVITKFECSKGDSSPQKGNNSSSQEVVLRANGYYTLSEGTGKYQKIDRGYRFLTGSFREQSIVQARKGYALVATKDEAKSMSLSVIEAAPVCAGGNIYR